MCVNYIQKPIQHPAVKGKSLCRENIGDHQCGF